MTSQQSSATGTLKLLVRRVTFEAKNINSYELVDPNNNALPPFSAGAHIDIHLPGGLIRQYSLCNSPREKHRYVIGVLRDPNGAGGSMAVHRLHAGDFVEVSVPRNNFALTKNAQKSILLAGGIGITPIKSMMHALASQGEDFELHYCCKGPEFAAFSEDLRDFIHQGKVHLHFDGGDPTKGFNLKNFLRNADQGCHVYYCGPLGFMSACKEATEHWPAGTVHCEHFKAPPLQARESTAMAGEDEFIVKIASTGEELKVKKDESLADVLQKAGYPLETSCQSGLCGTCKLHYLSGEVEHLDYILNEDERNSFLTPCVSRAKSGLLVVDL